MQIFSTALIALLGLTSVERGSALIEATDDDFIFADGRWTYDYDYRVDRIEGSSPLIAHYFFPGGKTKRVHSGSPQKGVIIGDDGGFRVHPIKGKVHKPSSRELIFGTKPPEGGIVFKAEGLFKRNANTDAPVKTFLLPEELIPDSRLPETKLPLVDTWSSPSRTWKAEVYFPKKSPLPNPIVCKTDQKLSVGSRPKIVLTTVEGTNGMDVNACEIRSTIFGAWVRRSRNGDQRYLNNPLLLDSVEVVDRRRGREGDISKAQVLMEVTLYDAAGSRKNIQKELERQQKELERQQKELERQKRGKGG